MNEKTILIFIVISLAIFILPQVQAARIYGNIYGPDLELLKNTVISVNSSPKQTLVAADAAYSFELTPGSYTIEAYNSESFLYGKEEINISVEGSYVLDLILFEMPEFEDFEFNESELILIEKLFEEKKSSTKEIVIAVLIVVLIIAAVVAYFVFRYKKIKVKKKIKKVKKPKLKKEKIFSPDETLNKIINLIKKEKRMTQKELRKQLGMSEAKVSLIIADLEDRGTIRKIKKGRGNIIIWQGE